MSICRANPGWMHEMIEKHAATAASTGARIVHSCGFDSVPFDLGVYFLQEAAVERFGAPMPRVRGRGACDARRVFGRNSGLDGGYHGSGSEEP